AYMKACERLFRELRPSIVHSHMNSLSVFPLKAAKDADVPVRIAHSHSTSNPREYAKTAMKMVLRPFSRVYPTHYAACSRYTARWLFGDKLAESGKVRIVRNAIEPDRFRFDSETRAAKRDELGVSDNQLVIGQVGRMCFQKNQLFTLVVFSKLLKTRPDAILVLAGDGDIMPQVRQHIGELGLSSSVRVLGVRSDINELYQAFDVLALPSTYEGLGMVAIEAQASGMPVIASDQVPGEAGLIPGLVRFVPLDRPGEWVKALASVQPTPYRPDEQEAIQVAGYDIEESAKQLGDWYMQLAG
ncbi:glycosyltransferase, partial [Bifidobacterium imperatoris]